MKICLYGCRKGRHDTIYSTLVISYFNLKTNSMLSYVYMHFSVYVHLSIKFWRPEEGTDHPGIGDTCSCKLPNIGVENTSVLYMRSNVLNSQSTPQLLNLIILKLIVL